MYCYRFGNNWPHIRPLRQLCRVPASQPFMSLCTLYTVKCTLYTVYCTLYTVHCTLSIVHSTLYTVHCTLYTVHCLLYPVHCTLYTAHCTLYYVHCTIYTIHCSLYNVHCTLYTLHCTIYNVHCTMYTVQCTPYTVHYTLYTIHCTMYNVHFTENFLYTNLFFSLCILHALQFSIQCTQYTTHSTPCTTSHNKLHYILHTEWKTLQYYLKEVHCKQAFVMLSNGHMKYSALWAGIRKGKKEESGGKRRSETGLDCVFNRPGGQKFFLPVFNRNFSKLLKNF